MNSLMTLFHAIIVVTYLSNPAKDEVLVYDYEREDMADCLEQLLPTLDALLTTQSAAHPNAAVNLVEMSCNVLLVD